MPDACRFLRDIVVTPAKLVFYMSPLGRHFVNASENLVVDYLRGLGAMNSHVSIDEQNKIVYVKYHDRSKVALVCGGGSGHEPSHAGYVGKGILTGAICGNIFASPNPSQIRKALSLVDNDKGIVIIVKNYTGDVLNFGLAKEKFAALNPEKANRLKLVIVGDDVAVGREQGNIVGRRGLAGTVLVYKIAGALANRGGSVDEVYSLASWLATRLATIGVSLGHTHVPGTKRNDCDILFSEIEIGMGIHNESGHRRLSPVPRLSDLIPQLLDLMTSISDPDRSFVSFKGNDNVVLLVNNLGGVSELELGSIVFEIKRQLEARGFIISRILSGTYMTSLNMPGFSITLLLLPQKHESDAPSAELILSLLDEQPEVPAWKWASRAVPVPQAEQFIDHHRVEPGRNLLKGIKVADPNTFVERLRSAAMALIKAEQEITEMDFIAGDGDCGLTLKAGAESLLAKLDAGLVSGHDVVGSIVEISQIAEEHMGGTSGALYSIFFSALAQGILENARDGEIAPGGWGYALVAARDKLYAYTLARPPSRTLVDPLAAFIDAYSDSQGNYSLAVKAAADAAEVTKDLDPIVGRSAYLEKDRLKREKIPDPGAWGVKVILENL